MTDTTKKAFPQDCYEDLDINWDDQRGVDLRDYFAAKAMQSLLSGLTNNLDQVYQKITAELAYEFADAMMEARK